MRFLDIKGAPEVGWHILCSEKDPVFMVGGNPAAILKKIISRHYGHKRIVSRLIVGCKEMYVYKWGEGLRHDTFKEAGTYHV